MENQKSIQFEEYTHTPSPSLLSEKISQAKTAVTEWLDSKSEFYSRIAEFNVTRRQAIRIGIVLPLLLTITGIAVAMQPIVAIIAGAASAWIVYHLNHEKGGQE